MLPSSHNRPLEYAIELVSYGSSERKQFCVHDIPWIDIFDINRDALLIKSVPLSIIFHVQGTNSSHIHSANVEYHPDTPKDHGFYQQLVGRGRYVSHSGSGNGRPPRQTNVPHKVAGVNIGVNIKPARGDSGNMRVQEIIDTQK